MTRHTPEAVVKIANLLLVWTVGAFVVGLVLTCIIVSTVLGIFHKLATSDMNALLQSVVIMMALFALLMVIRFGWINKMVWAYYFVRLMFFPSLLDDLLYHRKNPDWLNRLFKDPETIAWFFERGR